MISAGLTACKSDADDAGRGVLNSSDSVYVAASTLGGITSSTDSIQGFSITQTPDSFLIGECNTREWATIKADIMAQFACPVGAEFPDSSHIDSIALVMTYNSWFGDGNSPLRMSVYEMDKATFDYDSAYTSQEDINRYWSRHDSTHVVVADQMVVASTPNDSVYSSELEKYLPYVRFWMNDRFVERFNTIHQFPKLKDFTQFFKGLYITTTWGASTALYVDNLTLVLYYHYYYKNESGEYVKGNDAKYLYANSEVRQVNRFSFPYKKEVVNEMQAMDSLNFVVSPGYVYTVLKLPLAQYTQQIADSVICGDKSKHAYINKSLMRIDVANIDHSGNTTTKWAEPASDMLLIRRDKLSEFFATSNVPDDDYCLFSTLKQTADSLFNYQYYYSFDFSSIIQNALSNPNTADSVLEMVMVPVFVEYTTTSSSTSISQVKINQTITFTSMRSANDPSNPMNIDAVFSGFSVGGIQ